jgi:DNA-binding LytR/AlgR family response regulator
MVKEAEFTRFTTASEGPALFGKPMPARFPAPALAPASFPAPSTAPASFGAPSCFYVRDRGRFWRIENAEVLYIEAQKSYCRIRTREKLWVVMGQIGNFESALPANEFVRIHRSYIIGWQYLQSFDNRMVYLPGHQLPIGESYRCMLEQKLMIIQPGNAGQAGRTR